MPKHIRRLDKQCWSKMTINRVSRAGGCSNAGKDLGRGRQGRAHQDSVPMPLRSRRVAGPQGMSLRVSRGPDCALGVSPAAVSNSEEGEGCSKARSVHFEAPAGVCRSSGRVEAWALGKRGASAGGSEGRGVPRTVRECDE